MARFIATKDWSDTTLGPIEAWPQSLRTALSLTQASSSPISLAWGEGHVQIYNDGYWPICGAKHPDSMGQDFRECWASAFPVIGDAYHTAWSGRSAYLEKMRMFLDRYGILEETWFTFSFSPITDESGRVGGLFHPVTELTAQMLSERRTRALRDLATAAGKAKTTAEAFALSMAVLTECELDVPFVLLYALEDEGRTARLVGRSGIDLGTRASPELLDLSVDIPGLWSIAEVARTSVTKELDATGILANMPAGPYPETPTQAFALPIAHLGTTRTAAVMIAGVSARLRLDDGYRGFYELLAAAVAGSLATARAYEEERQRAEKLAEIDRAKTAFFSNVSHEFRTPLTLILGPVEDAITDDRALDGESLAAVHRSAVRLLGLVNSLLEFSRAEAGRLQASFEETDLAALTSGLAGSFESLVESARMRFVVDCPPLPQPVFVDRAQWAKIVLNLVSNAFKFTFDGSITVRLRAVGDHAELSVTDTGTGIPEHELPRVFERFHRIDGARGRSFEGSGIGLALVHELATQHGGSIRAESAVDRGSTFTVSIPFGRTHLSEDRIVESRPLPADRTGPTRQLIEAQQWDATRSASQEIDRASESAGRVLIADDNNDMRSYIARLLEPHWQVTAVTDGDAALRAIRESAPDLVLSDVMMPRMDGFALVRAIRDDPATRSLPVILLSARAGEDAVVGGIESGADDYLVKPFAARELISRVRTHLEMAKVRGAAERAATELAETRAALLADLARQNKELEAFSYSVSHDLRAPLRSIDGFTKALVEEYADKLDPQGMAYLGRVGAGARRMGELIDDLLLLAQVSRAGLNRVQVDLADIARDVERELRAGDPERVLDLNVQERIGVDADRRLMRVLFDNLLGNAWKFTSKTARPRVEVGQTARGGQVVCFVRDNGAGFQMDYVEKLFRPFQRLHRESDFPGTGIGLATVQRIIERHGGEVWAEGSVGGGATIYFTIPPVPDKMT
jgi:signal transduction histidine kinase